MTENVEDRVRSALTARAGQIGPGSLRPALPPTAMGHRRGMMRLWVLAAALAAAAVFLFVLLPGNASKPDLPATTVPPAPQPSSSVIEPQPSSSVIEPQPSLPEQPALSRPPQ